MTALAFLAAAWTAAVSGASGAPKPIVDLLSDGTELVFIKMPGAEKVALRWVVRSGGAADPPGKAGLAHLLEHLIFHGSYDHPWEQLWNPAGAAGARINAFTSPDYTFFVLDAPNAAFRELASRFIDVITNPALMLADLEHEKGVVSNEGLLRNPVGMLWMVDQLLFSGVERGATVIGTRRTRDQIQRADLAKFYASHYLPSNTTVIIAGDLELLDARKLIEENTKLAPELPGEKLEAPKGEVNLPLKEKTFAPYALTAFGYELAGVDRATCRDLARLLELRVMIAAEIERPVASDVIGHCAELRGHDFLFLFAESRSFDGEVVPELLRNVFARATKTGPSSKERDLLRARGKRILEALRADPAALADALVPEVAIAPRSGAKRRFDAVLSVPKLDTDALLKAAKGSFREKRSVEITLSPFGG